MARKRHIDLYYVIPDDEVRRREGATKEESARAACVFRKKHPRDPQMSNQDTSKLSHVELPKQSVTSIIYQTLYEYVLTPLLLVASS